MHKAVCGNDWNGGKWKLAKTKMRRFCPSDGSRERSKKHIHTTKQYSLWSASMWRHRISSRVHFDVSDEYNKHSWKHAAGTAISSTEYTQLVTGKQANPPSAAAYALKSFPCIYFYYTRSLIWRLSMYSMGWLPLLAYTLMYTDGRFRLVFC